jgi:hypothetical protein
MGTIFLFLDISRLFGKLTCGDFPYLFPSACKIMEDLDSITQEKLEICRGLTGEERSEFIENHLDDYYFAMNIVTNRKVLRHYRELFTKLIKDFGH